MARPDIDSIFNQWTAIEEVAALCMYAESLEAEQRKWAENLAATLMAGKVMERDRDRLQDLVNAIKAEIDHGGAPHVTVDRIAALLREHLPTK